MKTDYTGITKRDWSDDQNVTLEEGEVALVAKSDGSLWLHMPGGMDDVANQQQQLMMLASLLFSGTPMAESLFEQVVDLREQNLELVSVCEDVPN